VLILDEPTLGLDIMTSRTIIDFIRSAAASGKTVIFSTHYMEEAELLCARIGLLHQGRLMDVDSWTATGRRPGSDIWPTSSWRTSAARRPPDEAP